MKTKDNNYEPYYYFIPMAFVGTGYLNIQCALVGLSSNDIVRKIIVWGVIFLGLSFSVYYVFRLHVIKNNKLSRMMMGIWILFALLYLWAFFLWNQNVSIFYEIVSQGIVALFGLCAISLLIIGNYLIFLKVFLYYSVSITPAFVVYIFRFYQSEEARYFLSNWGNVDYMSIAYTALLFAVAMVGWMIYCKKTKKQTIFAICFIGLCSAVIVYSDCKGAVLCLLCLSIMLLIYGCRERVSRRIVIVTFAVIILGGIISYYAANSISEGRLHSFVSKEIINQNSQNSSIENGDSKLVWAQELLEKEGKSISIQGIIDYYEDGDLDTLYNSGKISTDDYYDYTKVVEELLRTNMGPRLYLYSMSVKEIKTNPVTVKGPLYFQNKYNTYPHNILLEIAVDFGFPVMIIVAIAVVISTLYGFRLSFKDNKMAIFMIYILTLFPRAMVSGNAYEALSFVQYGVLLTIYVTSLLNFKNNKSKIWTSSRKEEV